MEEPNRSLTLWLAVAALLAAAGFALATAGGAFAAVKEDHFHFWRSAEFLLAVVLVGAAVGCVVAAARGVTFPGTRAALSPSPPELVSAEHRAVIAGIVNQWRTLIEASQPVRATDLERNIVSAHWPELLPRVDDWTRVAERQIRGPIELKARFQRELDAMSLSRRFDRTAIADGFADLTLQRALGGTLNTPLRSDQVWRVWQPTDGPADGAHVNSFREIAIGMGGVPDEQYARVARTLIAAVQPLFDAAQHWPEAVEVPAARDAAIAYDRAPVIAELERIVVPERLAAAAACPVCGSVG